MLNILIAETTITELPNVEGTLYIIADENCTAPLTTWFLRKGETKFLPLNPKDMTPVMLALAIGRLIGNNKEVVLYGTDALVKPFANIKFGDCTFSLGKAKKPSAKRTGKMAASQPEAAEEKPESKPKRRKKSAEEMLSEIGFTDKAMVESIKEAVRQSSDAKIGLPVQLKMQFVLFGISEDAETVSRKIEPVYDRLKKSMES